MSSANLQLNLHFISWFHSDRYIRRVLITIYLHLSCPGSVWANLIDLVFQLNKLVVLFCRSVHLVVIKSCKCLLPLSAYDARCRKSTWLAWLYATGQRYLLNGFLWDFNSVFLVEFQTLWLLILNRSKVFLYFRLWSKFLGLVLESRKAW